MANFNQCRRRIAKYPENSKRNGVKTKKTPIIVSKFKMITCMNLVWQNERDLKQKIPRIKETVLAHVENAPETPSKKAMLKSTQISPKN